MLAGVKQKDRVTRYIILRSTSIFSLFPSVKTLKVNPVTLLYIQCITKQHILFSKSELSLEQFLSQVYSCLKLLSFFPSE